MKKIIVASNQENQTLYKFLKKFLNEATDSFIYKMLRKKNITLNGKKASGREKINVNDEISLFLSDETIEKFQKETEVVKYNIDIVYEDDNIIVVNKPSGVLSQKAKRDDISLNEMILSYCIDEAKAENRSMEGVSPGVCNRLDRNTSGLVIAGKTLSALLEVSELLRDRSLEKYYITIVKGIINKKQLIKNYLYKDEKSNKVKIFESHIEGSSYIETEYIPLAISDDGYTLLKVHLITGKSHQIRAHLSYIGYPIVGDKKYGGENIGDYQFLHSYLVKFPMKLRFLKYLAGKEITAKLPDKMKKFILKRRWNGELEWLLGTQGD